MQAIDIMIVGVGGQGTLLASKIMGALAMGCDLDVKLSEVHGMAQRGGSVETHVRIAENVAAPLIAPGTADYVLSFEPLEAVRWSHFVKKGGLLLTNASRIWPMSVVSGRMPYPEDLDAKLQAAEVSYIAVDAQKLAEQAGSPRSVNIALLGLLAAKLSFSMEDWEKAIAACVPAKTLEGNLAAFRLGVAAAADPALQVRI